MQLKQSMVNLLRHRSVWKYLANDAENQNEVALTKFGFAFLNDFADQSSHLSQFVCDLQIVVHQFNGFLQMLLQTLYENLSQRQRIIDLLMHLRELGE
jgi:hypothetical protein